MGEIVWAVHFEAGRHCKEWGGCDSLTRGVTRGGNRSGLHMQSQVTNPEGLGERQCHTSGFNSEVRLYFSHSTARGPCCKGRRLLWPQQKCLTNT